MSKRKAEVVQGRQEKRSAPELGDAVVDDDVFDEEALFRHLMESESEDLESEDEIKYQFMAIANDHELIKDF